MILLMIVRRRGQEGMPVEGVEGHFLASDAPIEQQTLSSLARKWSCSIGKNDRGGVSTGGVLLGCNV